MAVNLSPVYGVAGQVFDNNGNPLAGGKIYTYLAGTTTNAATYTSSSGAIAHSNPIVLDGAGRVPSGEIWLTDGITYKFVVEDSASNLIGTYDNLTGINSNFVAYTNEQEIQTATAGQTVFTLTTTQYQPGTNNLSVFVDGVNQYGPGAQYAYVETSATVVTFVTGLHVGASVKFTTSQLNTGAGQTAGQTAFTGFKGQSGTVQDLADNDGSDWIGFLQTGSGAVAISAQDKMRQIISVKDYGAVGNGIADDTAAIQAALDAATFSGSTGRGWAVYLPNGRYMISSTLQIPNATVFFGAGRNQTGIRPLPGFTGVMITDKGNASKVVLRDFRIDGLAEPGITDLIKMGYGAEPLGGGEWNNLFFYGGNVGAPSAHITGINAVTNVFTFTEIEGGFCGTDFKLGPNSGVTTYTRCFTISAVNYGFQLNGSACVRDCEIEAPGAACVGVYASRETVISNLSYSTAAGRTNPFAIEIDASCPRFVMDGFIHLPGAGSTLTNVIKDNRAAFPTNWGPTGATKNIGLLSDDLYLGTAGYYIQNQQRQIFKFQLTNNAGTIQHRIGSLRDVTQDSAYANKITGATSTYNNTPSGPDATTAFVAGAKIASINTSFVIFNTASQTNTNNWSGFGVITDNSTGTALNVAMSYEPINVNGVTRYYLIAVFTNATTGASYDLTTLPLNKGVAVAVEVFLI